MGGIKFIGPIEPVDRGTVRIYDTGDPNLPIDWAQEERQDFVKRGADPVSLIARANLIALRISQGFAALLFAAVVVGIFGWHP